MPWSENDYPAALENLTEEVRDKAIEIANALLEEKDCDRGRAIPIAIAQAEEWASRRGKPVKQRDYTD
ncbi:MAG: hypothetical protein KME26_16200 [Oscillatoria princeps RMCB-10]|jgi:uncharacterized protein YdaT|nr:hypothetical protein [Oscillatoria princeps RMCB-10]